MRHAIFASVLSLGALTAFAADPAPLPAPPVSPPAAVAPASAAVPVLLLPFRLEGNGQEYTWISQAMDEDLRLDLSRNSAVHLLSLPATGPADRDAALKAARDAQAVLLVYGTYQVTDTDLRVLGEVVDVASGKTIKPLKLTGGVRALFHMEDALSNQVQQTLPQGPASPAVSPYGAMTAPAQASDQAATNVLPYSEPAYSPVYTYPAEPTPTYEYPPVSYAYPDSGDYYPYGFDYYDPYLYGDFGVGFFIGDGFGRRDFDHDRGRDHGRGDRGIGDRGIGNRGGFATNSGFRTGAPAIGRSSPSFSPARSFGGGFRGGMSRGGFGGMRGGGGGGMHGGGGGHR